MEHSLPDLRTFEDLYAWAKKHGYKKTARLLRSYVDGGQPEEFMPDFTSRAMCRCAGMALDNLPLSWLEPSEEHPCGRSYFETSRGSDLYTFMWRGGG